jgi:hypothetical protein
VRFEIEKNENDNDIDAAADDNDEHNDEHNDDASGQENGDDDNDYCRPFWMHQACMHLSLVPRGKPSKVGFVSVFIRGIAVIFPFR